MHKESHLSLHFLFPLLRQEERYTACLISLNSNFHFEFYRIQVELFTESSFAANISQLQKWAQTVSLFIISPRYQHIRLWGSLRTLVWNRMWDKIMSTTFKRFSSKYSEKFSVILAAKGVCSLKTMGHAATMFLSDPFLVWQDVFPTSHLSTCEVH